MVTLFYLFAYLLQYLTLIIPIIFSMKIKLKLSDSSKINSLLTDFDFEQNRYLQLNAPTLNTKIV